MIFTLSIEALALIIIYEISISYHEISDEHFLILDFISHPPNQSIFYLYP